MSLKLTVKTLQQKQFQIDVDPESLVSDVKKKIEESQGHPVALQKLIFSGKILLDELTLETYKIKSEKDFLVLMVSKPKPGTATPTFSGTVTESTSAPAPAPAPVPSPAPVAETVTVAPTAPVPDALGSTPSEAPTPAATSVYDGTGVVTGHAYEAAVQSMMEMGFERAQVQRAMRASFNNPDRAAEYLMTGIPDNEPQASAAAFPPSVLPPSALPSSALPSSALPPLVRPPNAPAAPQAGNPQNLFTAGSQQAAAAAAAQQQTGGASDLSFLRNQPQFQQLRQLVQSNPNLLQPLLQQLGQSNPELLQLINANQQAFLELLNDGGADEGEGGAPPGAQYIQVTPEEKDAIDRLESLGFDRALAIEAYFACDKNEEIAANYLLEHSNDEWQ